jgi:hypothetical protein
MVFYGVSESNGWSYLGSCDVVRDATKPFRETSSLEPTKQSFQRTASFWLVVATYVIGGAATFIFTSFTRPIFTPLNDDFSLPLRIILTIGPAGWLALSVAGALATLAINSVRWRVVSAILFNVLTIAVVEIVTTTNMERPSHIKTSMQADAAHRAI